MTDETPTLADAQAADGTLDGTFDDPIAVTEGRNAVIHAEAKRLGVQCCITTTFNDGDWVDFYGPHPNSGEICWYFAGTADKLIDSIIANMKRIPAA